MMDQLTGQTAIVMGATGGVGHAIARQLLASGASVVLVGRTESALERTIAESGWSSAPVTAHAVDLAIDADVQEFVERVGAVYPQLHVLVHAAGVIALGPVAQASITEFDRQYRVNIRAPYQLTQG